MDAVLEAILERIGSLGYRLKLTREPDYRYRIEVTSPGGERRIVRAHDAYTAAVELAQQVGIEPEEG